jgi:hypothetical protein
MKKQEKVLETGEASGDTQRRELQDKKFRNPRCDG